MPGWNDSPKGGSTMAMSIYARRVPGATIAIGQQNRSNGAVH
jgi:hypothetical protein